MRTQKMKTLIGFSVEPEEDEIATEEDVLVEEVAQEDEMLVGVEA
jgi:hypothetical protein